MGWIFGYFVIFIGKYGFCVYMILCYLRYYYRYCYENKVYFCVKNFNEVL